MSWCSHRTTFIAPSCAAMMKGVALSLSRLSGFAPAFSKTLAISAFPSWQARKNAERPFPSPESI